MEVISLIIALALPTLLGGVWLALLVPAATPGRAALVWGYGTLAGLLLIPLLMRLLNALGLPPAFSYTAPCAGLLVVAALYLHWRRRPVTMTVPAGQGSGDTLPMLSRLLIGILAALLLLRLASLGLEILWRPLFPWDATMHWATKARVWFDLGSIAPFVENNDWLKQSEEGVFTDHHPGYPITIPLLQVWINSAIGRWDESLMNLPWLVCLVGMGVAFFGQARVAGASVTTSLAFTYLLLSMPLINTHVALAGYADLFLGACYVAAIMAFSNWSVYRQSWQGGLALFFALCCLLIKNEGFYWLLTFVPALVVLLLPMRWVVILAAVATVSLACVLLFLPGDFVVAGHSMDDLGFSFRERAPKGIAISIYMHGSWHLLGYLLTGLFAISLVLARPGLQKYAATLVALACALVLFMILFTMTGYAGGAIAHTAVGRISIQLVPSLTFFALLLWVEIQRRTSSEQLRE